MNKTSNEGHIVGRIEDLILQKNWRCMDQLRMHLPNNF